MKSKKYLLLLMLLLPLISYSCKDEITTPNDPPGRRDYVWSVDTISNGRPWNHYFYLWSTSPSNLWCIGTGGDFDKMILHYDGKTWTNYKYPGQAIEPWSIFGLSDSDFWVGGGSGLLFRYKDGNFSQFGSNYKLEGYNNTYFMNIFGNTVVDIYTVGSACKTSDGKLYAIVMHYDGNNWKYVIKPEIETQFLDIKRGEKDSPNYYLTSYNDLTDSSGIYEFDGKNLKRIYYNNKWISLLSLNNNIYFGIDKRVYKYYSGSFSEILNFENANVNMLTHINGRSLNDLFVNRYDGIGHFNGTDIETIFKLDYNTGFTDAKIFDKDVFFVCFSNNKYFIVHGKLK